MIFLDIMENIYLKQVLNPDGDSFTSGETGKRKTIMNNFYIFIAVACLLSFLITFGLGRLFRKTAIVKYIPAIISALAGIGFYIRARFFSTGFDALGYIILVIIAGIVCLVSLLTAAIMGMLQRSRQNY